MTRTELTQRLQEIQNKAAKVLRLLETEPLSVENQTTIRALTQWVKDELQNEYKRVLPERAQKTMTIFELSVYSPTIEEAWKKIGISRLKTDGIPDLKWAEPLEAVIYHVVKYQS